MKLSGHGKSFYNMAGRCCGSTALRMEGVKGGDKKERDHTLGYGKYFRSDKIIGLEP